MNPEDDLTNTEVIRMISTLQNRVTFLIEQYDFLLEEVRQLHQDRIIARNVSMDEYESLKGEIRYLTNKVNFRKPYTGKKRISKYD
jgi:hypothetical protein